MTGLRDGTPEEAGLSASRLAHASELAASFVEHGDHPAVVVLVARHGVVALHEAFGKLGPKPDDPPLPAGRALQAGLNREDAHRYRCDDPGRRRTLGLTRPRVRLPPGVLAATVANRCTCTIS